MPEVSRVPLYPVHRGRPVPEGDLEAFLPAVCGVREAPHGDDVVGKIVPYLPEHPALVHVRSREPVREHEERVDLYRRVRLDPVLDGPYPVVRLPPCVVASAEAGRVRRDDGLSPRKERQDVLVKPSPDDEPSSTLVLLDEDGVVGDVVDVEVLCEQRQKALRVPEGRIEQLPEEEGDEERALLGRRPPRRASVLPEREPVRVRPDRLDAQPDPMDHDVVVAAQLRQQRIDVYRERVDPRLTGKVEYPAGHFDFGGAHPETSL